MTAGPMPEIRHRIGQMGLPTQVWQVYAHVAGQPLSVHAFYSREKAIAFAQGAPDRHLKTYPLPIEDAYDC